MRDDLSEIVAFAKEAGCKYIQLNTNGIRLANDPAYVHALSEAGLSFVFLQFDGMDDRIYQTLRGEPLFKVKEKAIEICGKERLGVTLVPTLVPGVNTHQIGDIIRYVIANVPVIRGVHFQPVSYFGRIPQLPDDAKRYTLGELVDDIVEQTAELISRKSLVPSACDHPLCGLHGDYIALSTDGKCNYRSLARFIQLITTDLREELAVNVCLLVTLCVRHTGLVNFPQQHFRKALVNLLESIIE